MNKLSAREIRYLNNKRNLLDDGRLKSTGDRPADWYRAAFEASQQLRLQ